MNDRLENNIIDILCADDEEINWLVPQMFAQGALVCLAGEPGCLAGDTRIDYRRGARRSSRPLPLAEFYRKFNNLPCSQPPPFTADGPTYVHSLTDAGVMVYNQVAAVVESGIKPLVSVVFANGVRLRVTADHPVLTPSGYVQAGDLQRGQPTIHRGTMRAQGHGGRRRPRSPRVVVTTKHHPFSAEKWVNGYCYQRTNRARLVVEAAMNNVSYEEFVHVLKKDSARAATFTYLPPGTEVHHKDRDTLNDAPDNLEVQSQRDHARLHGVHDSWAHFNNEHTREVRVVSVRADATEMTYDIQMAGAPHNFCANGVVVHNSGKSQISYIIALAIASGCRAFSGIVPAGEPRRVLYFDEENSAQDRNRYLRRAWRGLTHANDGVEPDLGRLQENFWPMHFTLGDDDWQDIAAHAIEQVKPHAMFFDTATPAFNIQDENSNSEATHAIKKLRELMAMTDPVATAIVLKHAKLRTQKGRRTMRGAKAWQGSADSVIFQVKATGRPRKDGLSLTRMYNDKTRAFGLDQPVFFSPKYLDGDERKVLLIDGSHEPDRAHKEALAEEDAEFE